MVLLIGDVALAHDIGGLLAARRLELKLTIVLLDNGGGGIFDFLAVSRAPMARESGPRGAAGGQDIYTRHIATPTGLDFARAAALYGLPHERTATSAAFARRSSGRSRARARASSRCAVIGAGNVELHARVWDAVSRALSPPAAGAGPTA